MPERVGDPLRKDHRKQPMDRHGNGGPWSASKSPMRGLSRRGSPAMHGMCGWHMLRAPADGLAHRDSRVLGRGGRPMRGRPALLKPAPACPVSHRGGRVLGRIRLPGERPLPFSPPTFPAYRRGCWWRGQGQGLRPVAPPKCPGHPARQPMSGAWARAVEPCQLGCRAFGAHPSATAAGRAWGDSS